MKPAPLVFTIALSLASLAAAGRSEPPAELRFGLRAAPGDWHTLEAVLADHPADPRNPVGVTLLLPREWTLQPDWAALQLAVQAADSARARVTVETELPAAPGASESRGYLAELSDRVGPAVQAFDLSMDLAALTPTASVPGGGRPGDAEALALKELLLALRGTGDAELLLGEVGTGDVTRLAGLFERGLRSYVDGYSARGEGADGTPPPRVADCLQRNHLGAPLLLHLPRVQHAIAAQLLVLLAASEGIMEMDVESGDPASTWQALLALRSRITPRMGAALAPHALTLEGPAGPRSDIGIISLLDSDRMVEALALVPLTAGSAPGPLRIRLHTADVAEPAAYDLPDCGRRPVRLETDPARQESTLDLDWGGRALLVFYSRLKTGTVGVERLSVSATYRLPVEVIVARHQAVREAQDRRLDHYRAKATVDYQFQMPGGSGNLPVTFENTYFYERSGPIRWVQDRLLIGGVLWKGKIPELPVIEPARLDTPPLALTLGPQYDYRYLRDREVEGRDCFELEFTPLPSAPPGLSPGRAWIDKRTYELVRLAVRQTGLPEPQVSNDETDTYAPFVGPDQKTYWLLSKVTGQQLFTIGPVTLVATRTVTFDAPVINGEAYAAELAGAESSDRPILQETPQGYRYLVVRDGRRTLRMNERRSWVIGQAGFYYDRSFGSPLPLVGVNYFNYDWLGTRAQLVAFAAGALNAATLSRTNLFPGWDGSLQTTLFLVPYKDRVYPSGIEDSRQTVKTLSGNLSGTLGWRFNSLSKLSFTFGVDYERYARASSASSAFTLPPNHADLGLGVGYTFAWKGWSVAAGWETYHRTKWGPWGLPPNQDRFEGHRNYQKWSGAIGKTFGLPASQQVGLGLTYLGGDDLDRFSKYQFTYLGSQSMAGFAGSGIRFDQGAIASLAYHFNLADVVRFGVTLDHARVEPAPNAGLTQHHTGVGIKGAVGGPWQTYITLDVGYALRSDVPDVAHQRTVSLVVWKLW